MWKLSNECSACSCLFLLFAMATAWTVGDIKKEMDDVIKLIQQKEKNAKSSGDLTSFQKRLCAGLIGKLDQIKDFTVGKALELYEHIDASQMPETMKDMIKQKVEDTLETHATSPQRQEGVTFTIKPQYMSLPAYLSASDWQVLKTSANYHAKIKCICSRLKALGLQSLAEKSVGSAVVCILTTLTVVPEPSIIHKLVQDVKLSFMTTPTPAAPLQYVGSYPLDPRLLGEEFLQKAYGDTKPLLTTPEEYQSILRIVPLRSSSKMLSKGTKTIIVDKSSDSPGTSDQSGQHGNNLLQGMQGIQGLNGLLQIAGMVSSLMNNQKHVHDVQHDNQQPEKKQGALALTDVEPPIANAEILPIAEEKSSLQLEASKFQPKLRNKTKSDSSLEGQEQEDEKSAEKICADAEKAAYEALKSRSSSKKQEVKKNSTGKKNSKGTGKKGKGKQNKGKGKGMKRPAAAMAHATTEFKYECPSPDSTWDSRNKESWKSKHYHLAREQALKCGKTKDEALACGRIAHKKAAEKWFKKYNE